MTWCFTQSEKRDFDAIGVVSIYRRIRERLGDEEVADFDRVLIAETAKAMSMSPERVPNDRVRMD